MTASPAAASSHGIRPRLAPLRRGALALSGLGAEAGERLRPVARRAGRIAAVVTPLGWGTAVVTVVAGLAGIRLGWWELTTVALCGAALLAVCALFLIGRTEYDVSLDLTQQRVVVGERAVGSLELRNPGRRALLPSRVILPVGSARAQFGIPRLAPDAAHDELFSIPTARRAVLQVGPVSAVRGDPLGLFERTHAWTDPLDLYVHPKTVRLDGSTSGFVRDLEGLPTRDLSNDDVSFHALREYVPGDDRRHVHWRSSARTGRLMVRQFEDTRRSQIVVALSSAAAEYADDDEYELAVSAAASFALQALREGRELTLVTHGARVPATHARRLLDALSGIETGRHPSGIPGLTRRLRHAAPRASVLALVTGSRAASHELSAAARFAPDGSRVVELVCRVGTAPSVRRNGDSAFAQLGDLGDLPAVVRGALS